MLFLDSQNLNKEWPRVTTSQCTQPYWKYCCWICTVCHGGTDILYIYNFIEYTVVRFAKYTGKRRKRKWFTRCDYSCTTRKIALKMLCLGLSNKNKKKMQQRSTNYHKQIVLKIVCCRFPKKRKRGSQQLGYLHCKSRMRKTTHSPFFWTSGKKTTHSPPGYNIARNGYCFITEPMFHPIKTVYFYFKKYHWS